MKTTKLFRLILLLIFIIVQQMNIRAQVKASDRYYAMIDSSIFVFKIAENKGSYIISKLDLKTDTVIKSDTIVDINDSVALISIVQKLDSVKFEYANRIADKLLTDWNYRQKKSELIQKSDDAIKGLENDIGDNIGILSVKKQKIKACVLLRNNFGIYSDEKSIIYVQIDSVEIAFECGQIKDVIVKTRYKKNNEPLNFTNPNYIPVRNSQDFDRLSKRGEFYLISSITKDSVIALDVADVLYFSRKISALSGTYIPNDTTLILFPLLKKGVKLYKSSVINNLDLRIFTDVLGYNNQSSPNGIIQSDIQINFGLNQRSSRFTIDDAWNRENRRILLIHYRYKFIWLNRISPFIRFSKIENTSKELFISDSQTKNLLDLFKYSNTNIGTELNIFTYKTDSKMFTHNIGVGVLRTKVSKDSINNTNFNVSTAYINPCLNFQFFESNRIDFNFKLGAYCGWLVTTIDPEIFSSHGHSVTNYIAQGEHWWYEIGQSINLHPNGRKSGSIFIRASQFLSTNNNHFTFQIGYATTISKILKF